MGATLGLIMTAKVLFLASPDNVGITQVVVMDGVMNAISTAHTFVRLRVANEGTSLEELKDIVS